MRKHGVRARHLQQRRRQAVAIREARLVHRLPGLGRPQLAAGHAGERQFGLGAETERAVELPHFLRRQLHGHAGGADVARLLNDLRHRQLRVRVDVGDRVAADGERGSGQHGVGRDAAAVERDAGDEGLHRRSGLEGVDQRAVAQLLDIDVAPLGRVVARVVGQRQHLAGLRIEHDDAAALGLVVDHRLLDVLVGEVLHLGVDRQFEIAAVRRRHLVTDVFDDAAQAVLDDHARAVLALQAVLERQLHALLAVIVDIGEADDVRRRFALGVLAPELARLVDALDAELADLLPRRVVDLALQPGEARVAVAEFFLDVGLRQAEQARQIALLFARGHNVFRDRPHRRHRHRCGEQRAVTVGDAAAAGLQILLEGVTLLALVEVELVVDDLDRDRARDEHARAEAHQRDDELAAPRRCLGGQQRARGVGDAAADSARLHLGPHFGLEPLHCVTPDADTSGT